MAFEILQGLVYLNRHNVTHRNLKPDNVLFDTEVKPDPISSYLQMHRCVLQPKAVDVILTSISCTPDKEMLDFTLG